MSKTELNPRQLYERRNTDDVFNLLVIKGLLRVLNRKLVIEQIWSNDEIENVTVPFFYDFGGSNMSSERFIQDNYTHFTDQDCTDIGLKKIDGNFDFYPQGRVSLGSVSIDSGNITNRFAMAQYTKYVDGKLQAFTSYLYSMPLQFQFSLEIRTDNMTSAFKIDQAYREFFYKNKTFHFNYRGTVCPCRIGFPESALSMNPGATYVTGTAPSENFITLKMSLQVETYQPVFDPFSEKPADCSIASTASGIWVNNTLDPKWTPKRTGPITFKTDFTDLTLISGQELLLEWTYSYTDRDLLAVDICYQLEGDDKIYVIDSVDNHNFYHWNIDSEFTYNERIDLIIPNTDYVSVSTSPVVYIYPDPSTGIVEPENVYVKNKGFIIAPEPDYDVDAIISYTNRDNEIVEYPATIHLDNFMIAQDNGIDFECFTFDNNINNNRVQIIVRDHYQKNIKAVSPWISIL